MSDLAEKQFEELNNRPHTTEDELLEETITVYEYQDGFRTTSSVKFKAYLRKQFSDLADLPTQLSKIKGVSIRERKFKEVEEDPDNPHKSRKPDDAETKEKLEEILDEE